MSGEGLADIARRGGRLLEQTVEEISARDLQPSDRGYLRCRALCRDGVRAAVALERMADELDEAVAGSSDGDR